MKIRELKESEIDIWFELCEYNFGIPQKYFKEPFFGGKEEYKNIIVAVQEEKIIGGIRCVYRSMYKDGNKIRIGGITDINVLPSESKRIFILLINSALEKFKRKGICYVIGYTNITAPKLLRHMNAYSVMKKVIYGEIVVPKKNDKYYVRKYRKDDLEKVINIYNVNLFKNKYGFTRSKAYWESYIQTYLKCACVCEVDGSIVGYIICNGILKGNNQKLCWNVAEYGSLDDRNLLPYLLTSLMDEFHFPKYVRIPQVYCNDRDIDVIHYSENTNLKVWELEFTDSNKKINIEEFAIANSSDLDHF